MKPAVRAAHARNLLGAALRSAYRISVSGAEFVPLAGPALIVADQPGILVGPVIKASLPRPGQVLASAEAARVVPSGALRVAGDLPPGSLGIGGVLSALQALRDGQAVVLVSVDPAAGLLAAASGAPVVPVHLDGAEGRLPSDPPAPGRRIAVQFGTPLPPTAPVERASWIRCLDAAERVRQAVADLRVPTPAHRTERVAR